jgi:hypothetical protein
MPPRHRHLAGGSAERHPAETGAHRRKRDRFDLGFLRLMVGLNVAIGRQLGPGHIR